MVDHVHYNILTNKMMSLLLLLSVAFASVAANSPNCAVCEYQNGIGFLAGGLCQGYYMCVKKPDFNEVSQQADATVDDLYRYYPFCCAEGLAWDQEHLTCKEDASCVDPRDLCPNITTTTNVPCQLREDPDDESKFITSNNVTMDCPYGQVFNQTYCTCVRGDDDIESPCSKILDFGFNGTYDSYSCYNFAKGDPYGEPSVDDNSLCLSGKDQFLTIGYLNNWFAWNPLANTFTLCLWINPSAADQTAAILNTNCDMVDPQTGASGSVVDLVLEGGVLFLNLGQNNVNSQLVMPPNEWTKICVVFDNGVFKVYSNGGDLFPNDEISTAPYTFAPNTHSSTTLGFKPGFDDTFEGYLDDFCFYTEAKDAESIKLCFDEGRSN